MQTGLGSFLDRMISGGGARPMTGDTAQKPGHDNADRPGLGGGAAIAMEFARLIRSLRADAPTDKSGEAIDLDAEENASRESDADADVETDAMRAVPGALMLHWNREVAHAGKGDHGEGETTNMNAPDADAVAALGEAAIPDAEGADGDEPASGRTGRRHGEAGTPDFAAGAAVSPSQAGIEGEGAMAGEAANAIRSGNPAQSERSLESVSTGDGAGEGEPEGALPAQERLTSSRQASAGEGREAGERVARLEQVRDNAHDHAPRGAGASVRVEIVAGQTHLPPASAAASNVQLLGDSIGEAINEMANARLSGEVSQGDNAGNREVGRRLVVDLHPRELGSVRVTLVKQAGELHIEIVPTTDKANDLLNSHRDALAQTIRQAGGAVTEISVRLSHDGAMGRDFQPGQNPAAFNLSGGNDSGRERSGDTRHPVPENNSGAQNRIDRESSGDPERSSRSGVYL
ncbi:MAG: flagellar hook-length control protein FliK [Nitratireductor sp.]|nr:flagellar hook-length control protein FliK [Nitratireductor sp.]